MKPTRTLSAAAVLIGSLAVALPASAAQPAAQLKAVDDPCMPTATRTLTPFRPPVAGPAPAQRQRRGTVKRILPGPGPEPGKNLAGRLITNESVGLLYSQNSAGVCGYCTATVMISPKGKSMLSTAAHCIHGGPAKPGNPAPGWHHNVFFIPGYAKGRPFPYGKFEVHRGAVLPGWDATGHPMWDVAFTTVDPNDRGHVNDLVSMNGLEVNAPPIEWRTIFGYRLAQTLHTCYGKTAPFFPTIHTIIKMEKCAVTGGYSGGPWFDDYDGTTGFVNGATSAGFDEDNIIFASYWGDPVWDSYWALRNG